MAFRIAAARPQDVATIVDLVRQLAAYEKLTHLLEVEADALRAELFGPRPVIECVLGWEDGPAGARAAGFALYFHNYSTFLGRRGLYLEDLFVVPDARGRGYGRALIAHLARLAVERGCGRFEWTVLDWNRPAIDFYRRLGADVLPDWRVCRLTGAALARAGGAALDG